MVFGFYNICLTSAPIFFFGIFEQNVSVKKLVVNPYIYRYLGRVPTSLFI